MDKMMDRESYETFRDGLRRLAGARIEPNAARFDSEARFPEESLHAFKELGLVSLAFPENDGGQGGDVLSQVIALEEIGRVCATSSLTLMVIWAGLVPISKHGSQKLRDEVIRPAMSGDIVASICLTEPAGGSNLFGLKTKAEKHADGWVLNGQKRYITNATRSDWYTVLARTGEKTLGLFAVHKDDSGLVLGAREKKMGIKGSPTADVTFENCRIPAHRAIGDPNQGHRYITDSLTWTRALIGGQALGIAQGALDQAVKYTSEREQFGETLSRFQMVRAKIADMATKVEAGRALLYSACAAIDNGSADARALASMAKLFCSDSAMEVTTEAVQLHGGSGYLADFPVERMMRDAKITQIYEGVNEIQRLIIAKHVYDRAGAR
ncbi:MULTISPECIES: acyl-CoA dehydrogenase family protein [unclassified Bosea (in: a-proteobacteria)]|nr:MULTISPECIES: acyl-CoA dehydrogenase family protein [unclassified Bosea (in: a-proteobacteria)]